jgi:hypothetical protein
MLITCGGCRKKLDVEERLAGQRGRCPACNAVIKIPTVAESSDRAPGSPLPVAMLESAPELLSAARDDRAEPGSHHPPDGAEPSGADKLSGLDAIQTDEEGFVIAVPVEQDEVERLATETPGKGVEVARPTGDLEEYALSDDPSPPTTTFRTQSTPPRSGAKSPDELSESLDQVFDDFDDDEDEPTPPAPAAADHGVSSDKIITRCPGCKGLLAIEAQFAGKMRTCPKCATEIDVPLTYTVVLPSAKRAQRIAGGSGTLRQVPSALTEDLSPDVDLADYVSGAGSGAGVAGYWVALAFVIGATVGFAVGWMLAGYYNRPGPPAVGSPPAGQVDSAGQSESQ